MLASDVKDSKVMYRLVCEIFVPSNSLVASQRTKDRKKILRDPDVILLR